MKPLLSLVMIVKNEESNLRAVLEAALPHVDRATILDTGSTDKTKEIASEALRASGKPFVICEEPFAGYATSRNRALQIDAHQRPIGGLGELDERAEFQLMLSGDEYLVNGDRLREHLEQHRESNVDLHFIRLVLDDSTLVTPRVFRSISGWRYESSLPLELHEYPAHPDKEAPVAEVPGALIDHRVADPEARLTSIWESHIPALRQRLEENPYDERALVFLAQSLEAVIPFVEPHESQMLALEAMGLLKRRLAINTGTDAERNYFELHVLQFGRMATVYDDAEIYRRALALHEKDPVRPETALLVVESATKLPTMSVAKVYEMATATVKVAEEARKIANGSPLSTAVRWRAHRIAAITAKQLSKKHPEFAKRVKEHIDAGLEAGGPWPAFKAILHPPKKAEAAETQQP